MSANPQDVQQMLAQYKALYGDPRLKGLDQIQQGLSAGVAPGANTKAAGVNAASQLIVALMKAQRQNQIQKQLNQGQTANQPPPMAQGQTLSTPAAVPSGMPVSPGDL